MARVDGARDGMNGNELSGFVPGPSNESSISGSGGLKVIFVFSGEGESGETIFKTSELLVFFGVEGESSSGISGLLNTGALARSGLSISAGSLNLGWSLSSI